MSTPFIVAIVGAVATVLVGTMVSITSWRNSRQERQHRESLARQEDWRRQRDAAIERVQSDDPVLMSIGFFQLTHLKDDPSATAEDRALIQRIGDRAAEAFIGKALYQAGESLLLRMEATPPEATRIAPGTSTPVSIAAAELLSRRAEDIRATSIAKAREMKLEGIKLIGGLPPAQQAS
ncbi:hypothetical protein [Mycobacteroides abscessus]|uniref:hypothetical protein n=1 Tax=Mycobacteroides abscessus TaxID=36809 RepID=UPI0009A80CDA|nr:hypothetical protein [Mycobacteroides abscessus]